MYSDYNSEKLIFRIRLNKAIQKKKKGKPSSNSLDQSDEIYILKNLLDNILNNLIIRGIKNIKKVLLRKITDNFEEFDAKYIKKEVWVLDTVGSNLLEILSLDFIDKTKTITNDIIEIYRVLGIEAARQAIFDEFSDVIEFDSTYINYHHLSILADRMTCNDKMVSIFRHGINNDNIGPIAKASFEETPEMFLKAARHGELDIMKGVSANIMCGQQGYYGTNAFKILTDIEMIAKTLNEKDIEEENNLDNEYSIDEKLKEMDDEYCNISNIEIQSTIDNVKKINIGKSDDYILDI
jgi:DNA-directed RNA polymerase II subunit RPB1